MSDNFFELAAQTEETIRIAAFSPNSKPSRFLCLAMRSQGRVGIRAMEKFGTPTEAYEPFRVQERLNQLEGKGFIVTTDSKHELFKNFPVTNLNERTHSQTLNRDHALDLLVEYKESGLLTLPDDHASIVPHEMDYRRVGDSVNSQYVFRRFTPQLNVLLMAIYAMNYPPMLSESYIDEFFGWRGEVEDQKDKFSTFRAITTELDKKIAKENDEKYWGVG